MNRPWTGDEEERLRVLYRRGVPVEDIAVLMDRTVPAIENACVRLGLNWRRRRWTREEEVNLLFRERYCGRSSSSVRTKRCRLLKGRVE